jgi:hypothetical protein
MKRGVKSVLAINLLALTILAFVFPQLMISPGKLIPAHARLETDCFACHVPLRGTSSARCIVCHKPADIGRLTTTGQPIIHTRPSTPFHQKLKQLDCMTCHSDHAGVARVLRRGRFDHALLEPDMRNQCESCHAKPGDTLHSRIESGCSACHDTTRWKPATFEHGKYFVLDRDHNVRCATCHEQDIYKRYTCYGCHEHTPGKIKEKHLEEGIRNFDDCVKCHRSADEHDIRYPGDTRSERKQGGKEND